MRRSTSAPQTMKEHADYLIKLVLHANAYCMLRSRVSTRVQEHLEKYFCLVRPTVAPTSPVEHPDQDVPMVRIHLGRALLLDFGQKIKYAHTLIAERQPPLNEQLGNKNFIAVNVYGFVRGGTYVSLERPALHLLTSHNILSIESLETEEACWNGGR